MIPFIRILITKLKFMLFNLHMSVEIARFVDIKCLRYSDGLSDLCIVIMRHEMGLLIMDKADGLLEEMFFEILFRVKGIFIGTAFNILHFILI